MLARFFLKILQIMPVLCLAGLVACAPKHTPHSPGSDPVDAQIKAKWDPEKVQLLCDNPHRCPENHGALLMAEESISENFILGVKKVSYSVVRCTAFAFGPHKLMTAGHCAEDLSHSRRAYFVTPQKPGRPGRLFHIKGIVEKRYAEDDPLTPDYAILETVEEMDFSTFAHPAQNVSPDADRFSAVVVNFEPRKTPDDLHLILQTFNCTPMKGNIVAPIEFKDRPDTFFVDGCPLDVGNSGGALTLADDLNAVLGVIKVKKPAGITNMGCFGLQDWPQQQDHCLKLDQNVSKKAADPFWKAEYAEKTQNILSAWLKTPESEIAIGQSRLVVGALPVFAPRRPIFDNLFERGDLELVLIPVPLCWKDQRPLAQETASLSWSNPLYEYGVDRDYHIKFSSTDRLDATELSLKRGALQLDFSELEQNFILDDEMKKTLIEAQSHLESSEIGICTGNEKQLFLRTLSR